MSRTGRAASLLAQLAVVTALLVTLAPAAGASHGSSCTTAFSSSERWRDRSAADIAALAARIADEIAGDIDEAVPMAITGAAVLVTRSVAYGFARVNAIHLACVLGAHWNDQDALMQLHQQSGLAVTSRPDAASLVPGPQRRPAYGANPFALTPDEQDGAEVDDLTVGFADRPYGGDTAPAPTAVKQVVHQALDDLETHTACACTAARSYLDQADAQLAAGNLKLAYRYYRQAYVAAVTAA